MDRFTKYVLVVMLVAVAAIVVSTYIGVYVFGGSMETKYMAIIEEQAQELGLPFSHVVELGETGEYVGFTLAGAIGGFIIGYLIPPIFEQKTEKQRRAN
jgi:ABC-type cobalt transport system substrate-binding protein